MSTLHLEFYSVRRPPPCAALRRLLALRLFCRALAVPLPLGWFASRRRLEPRSRQVLDLRVVRAWCEVFLCLPASLLAFCVCKHAEALCV